MSKKSVASLSSAEVSGKRVLVRADFNVPVDDGGNITDDTRIRAALPTIQDLTGKGAKVILTSHFGRPKGVSDKLRLTPVAKRLSELLGQEVIKCDDCIGDEVSAKIGSMNNGQVALLENVRFYPEEEKNDPEFAKKLAANADLYVNDAFGTAHRAHASTEGVTKYLSPSVAGYLIEKELQYLQSAIETPQRPLAAIVGGSIGGMQAMQWAVDFPEMLRACVSIGAAPLSAMGLALNHLQRQAIMNDPAWRGGDYEPDAQPVSGLALARGIAMCSYKSAELFEERFARSPNRSGEVPGRSLNERFDVAGYLDHQGEVFIRRFDANSYLSLSKAMDLFDLGQGYDSEQDALSRVTAKIHLVGISSDWLFPASDVRALAGRMRAAGASVHYSEIETSHGHDGFLAEPDRVVSVIRQALATGLAASGD